MTHAQGTDDRTVSYAINIIIVSHANQIVWAKHIFMAMLNDFLGIFNVMVQVKCLIREHHDDMGRMHEYIQGSYWAETINSSLFTVPAAKQSCQHNVACTILSWNLTFSAFDQPYKSWWSICRHRWESDFAKQQMLLYTCAVYQIWCVHTVQNVSRRLYFWTQHKTMLVNACKSLPCTTSTIVIRFQSDKTLHKFKARCY